MKPSLSTEVEVVETERMVGVDFFVEVGPEGVLLTIAADDRAEDIEVVLRGAQARELGDLLWERGAQASARLVD